MSRRERDLFGDDAGPQRGSVAKLVEIACEVRRVTDKAFLVFDGAVEAWVPKSQVEHHPNDDPRKSACIMVMPEWLAKDKGFI